jgi:hypothetical protein
MPNIGLVLIKGIMTVKNVKIKILIEITLVVHGLIGRQVMNLDIKNVMIRRLNGNIKHVLQDATTYNLLRSAVEQPTVSFLICAPRTV